MASWLSGEALLADLKEYYSEQHSDEIIKNWRDAKAWKRVEKRRLKENAPDFIWISDCGPQFARDFAGEHSSDLIEEHAADARRCWYRLFLHDEFADNFRLEVITTPDDSRVVGWCITVD